MLSLANLLKLAKIIGPLAGKAAQGLDKITWDDLAKAGKDGKAFYDDLAKEAGVALLAKQECAALEEIFKRGLGVAELEGDQAVAFELVMATLPKLAKAGETLVAGDLDPVKATELLLGRLALAEPEFGPASTNAHAVPVARAVFQAAFTRALAQPEALSKLGLAISQSTLSRLSSLDAKADSAAEAVERRHREQMAEQAKHMALTERLLEETAREKGVAPEKLRPLFEHLGRAGMTERQMREEADSAIAEILELARRSVPASNDADIAAVIEAARAKLRALDTRGARERLNAALREEDENRRRRRTPLLRERVAVEAAERDWDAAKATYAELAALDPDDDGRAFAEIGYIEQRLGRSEAALRAYRQALRRAKDGTRQEGVPQDRIGHILMQCGDLDGAFEAYRKNLALFERLATDDPGSAGVQRDLSVCHEKIGDVSAERGNTIGALESYREAFALSDFRAKGDPDGAEARRDLSVSHIKIGDVLAKLRDPTGALDAYRKGFALRERLAADDPESAAARRDLALSLERIGEMLAQLGDLDKSRDAYRESLELRERLARDDPYNAAAQRDLIASCDGLSCVDPEAAVALRTRALSIAEALSAQNRVAPIDGRMVASLRERLAAAKQR